MRSAQFGGHIKSEIKGIVYHFFLEFHFIGGALLHQFFKQHTFENGVDLLADVFQQDGLSQLDCRF